MMAQFKGMLHLLHKRMADISYPVSKQEILEQIGDETVKVDADQYLSVREIIAPIRQETFSCAARIRKGCCHIFSETERK